MEAVLLPLCLLHQKRRRFAASESLEAWAAAARFAGARPLLGAGGGRGGLWDRFVFLLVGCMPPVVWVP